MVKVKFNPVTLFHTEYFNWPAWVDWIWSIQLGPGIQQDQSLPRGSFFQQVIVAQEDPDIVEDFVELAGRGVKDEVWGYPHLEVEGII